MSQEIKVNVGGSKKGKNFKQGAGRSWLLADISKGADIVVDLNKNNLPLDDGSVAAIYTSHTLEHVFPDRIDEVLSDFYRALKKGGKIRIVVPDIDKAIMAYMKKDKKYLMDSRNPYRHPYYEKDLLGYLQSWFHSYTMINGTRKLEGGHANVFNHDRLKRMLKRAGFKNIKSRKYNDCDHVFRGCDFVRYRDCSIYMEAQK